MIVKCPKCRLRFEMPVTHGIKELSCVCERCGTPFTYEIPEEDHEDSSQTSIESSPTVSSPTNKAFTERNLRENPKSDRPTYERSNQEVPRIAVDGNGNNHKSEKEKGRDRYYPPRPSYHQGKQHRVFKTKRYFIAFIAILSFILFLLHKCRSSSDTIEKREFEKYNIVCEHKLTESDIQDFSKQELRIMRNWVYARHGYDFGEQGLKKYFTQFKWYKPESTHSEVVYSKFNDIEKYNVNFLAGWERYNIVRERELTKADLEGLSKKERRLMRHWVYAHYGYIFNSKNLKDYFSQFEWYTPQYTQEKYVYSKFNDIEKYNVDFINRFGSNKGNIEKQEKTNKSDFEEQPKDVLIRELRFSRSNISLGNGESYDLRKLLVIEPHDATEILSWSVANRNLLSINANTGVVTSYMSHSQQCVVAVTSKSGDAEATIMINGK